MMKVKTPTIASDPASSQYRPGCETSDQPKMPSALQRSLNYFQVVRTVDPTYACETPQFFYRFVIIRGKIAYLVSLEFQIFLTFSPQKPKTRRKYLAQLTLRGAIAEGVPLAGSRIPCLGSRNHRQAPLWERHKFSRSRAESTSSSDRSTKLTNRLERSPSIPNQPSTNRARFK